MAASRRFLLGVIAARTRPRALVNRFTDNPLIEVRTDGKALITR